MAEQSNGKWRLPISVALIVAVFSFIVVNYQVYTARWRFIEAEGEALEKPPTISRAITLADIGDPFMLWITAAGIALVVAVAIFVAYYMSLVRVVDRASWSMRIAVFILMPVIFVLQVASAWGMHTLSANTLVTGHDAHMAGSIVFFAAVALAVLLYGVVNHLLLRAPELPQIEASGRLNAAWISRRRMMAYLAFGLALLYGVLFQTKSVIPYTEAPFIYIAYVSTEPMVITGFLIVLVMACVDKLRA